MALSQKILDDVTVAGAACRELALGIRRPAITRLDRLAVIVGLEEGIIFSLTDGTIYDAKFSLAPQDRIDWARNGKDEDLLESIRQFLEIVAALKGHKTIFVHWCDRHCAQKHD